MEIGSERITNLKVKDIVTLNYTSSLHSPVIYLLILETLGTFSWLQTPSVSSLSLISQANMVGFSFLYLLMASTTGGVATLGLLPPITPAL